MRCFSLLALSFLIGKRGCTYSRADESFLGPPCIVTVCLHFITDPTEGLVGVEIQPPLPSPNLVPAQKKSHILSFIHPEGTFCNTHSGGQCAGRALSPSHYRVAWSCQLRPSLKDKPWALLGLPESWDHQGGIKDRQEVGSVS